MRLNIASQQEESIKQQLFRMQYVIDAASSMQDIQRLEQEVSLATTDLNVMVFVMLNSNSKILHANHVVWRNSRASQVIDGYQTQDHARVVHTSKPLFVHNWQRLSLQAYYPIDQARQQNLLERIDLIYVEIDLSQALATVFQGLKQRILWQWFLGTLLILFVCLLLHTTLLRPLRQLILLAEREDKDAILDYKPCVFEEVNVLHQYLVQANDTQKRSQKKLRDSEQRWLFAVEASRNGVWDWDISTGEVYMSDRWKEILGYAPSELKGEYQDWESRLHPEERVMVLQSLQKYLNGETDTFESVHRLKHKQGHYIWILDRGMLIDWDSDGRPKRIVGIHTDITEDVNRQQSSHIDIQAPSYEKLDAQLKALMAQGNTQQFGALFHIGVDNYQSICSSLGQESAKRIGTQLAARLSKLGGDLMQVDSGEFCLLMKGLSVEGGEIDHKALAVASEIRHLIARDLHVANQDINLNAMVGICVIEQHDLFEAEQVRRYAQSAMYSARNHADERCVIYSNDMDFAARRRESLREQLRQSVIEESLSLTFEPIVDSRGTIRMAESVLGWKHPQFGMIDEQEFRMLAEDIGASEKLHHWHLQQVCEIVNRADETGVYLPLVSLDVCAGLFNQPEFVDSALRILQRNGVAPQRVEFELDENTFLSNLNIVKRHIKSLRKHGFGVAIDHFGLGNGSLTYLSQLTVTRVKLSRTALSSVGEQGKSGQLTLALVDLLERLELSMVIQGVKSSGQFDHVRSANAYFQGDIFCKAVSGSELIYLIQKGANLPRAAGS
ncbi:EAL domain-containing protein [Shewanella gelidii]|uniref:Sensor domain-containing phosphodiesterase n=1 Tax=Shewanella gelidii TaxID=1642821 RepID=A0A917N9Y2_9GAMM|nr:EAL domain-containing protein [Shewanella gelidii]MCL1099187.1 EAL domain-containing protein [Shewanella gelidii]GGI81049.1 sensor domain-containing phosphodiesterase [Shewanella gelidii]